MITNAQRTLYYSLLNDCISKHVGDDFMDDIDSMLFDFEHRMSTMCFVSTLNANPEKAYYYYSELHAEMCKRLGLSPDMENITVTQEMCDIIDTYVRENMDNDILG